MVASGFASAFSGFGSGGFGAGGGVASAFGWISGLSDTLGAGSFTGGDCSPTLSTMGFGASALGAVFTPAMICESSESEIMSTASAGVDSILVDGRVTSSHTSTSRCPMAEIVRPALMRPPITNPARPP